MFSNNSEKIRILHNKLLKDLFLVKIILILIGFLEASGYDNIVKLNKECYDSTYDIVFDV